MKSTVCWIVQLLVELFLSPLDVAIQDLLQFWAKFFDLFVFRSLDFMSNKSCNTELFAYKIQQIVSIFKLSLVYVFPGEVFLEDPSAPLQMSSGKIVPTAPFWFAHVWMTKFRCDGGNLGHACCRGLCSPEKSYRKTLVSPSKQVWITGSGGDGCMCSRRRLPGKS